MDTKPDFPCVCAILLLTLSCLGCATQPPGGRIDVAAALSETTDTDCYSKALGPIDLVFPRDAGPHTDFKTEWWYYTGNLQTKGGRLFGFQFTVFRQALACPGMEKGTSPWRTRQLYFAHLAVTDTQNKTFHAAVRMNRESLGIAGSRARPFKVWIDDWRVEQMPGHPNALSLCARDKEFAIRFTLTPDKPMMLQGDKGFSPKGPGRGNASHYYSLPRIITAGEIETQGQTHAVAGLAWFDHEWSTTALGRGVVGWDWFAAHLDDGRDIMVCHVRKAGGKPNGYGFGAVSLEDGSFMILTEKDFSVIATSRWTSPDTAVTYPSAWQMRIPDQDLDFTVTPVIPNQEHTHLFAYWEGAVRLESKTGAGGFGYAELTGY